MINRSLIKAYTNAINSAALSRGAALQIELAVGFAVQLEVGVSKRLARATLIEVYAGAGYKCADPGEADWKAINRRIAASLALFEFCGREDVAKWGEGHVKGALIDAIAEKLKPLKLRTVNEVLLVCGKLKPPSKRAAMKVHPLKEKPGTLHVDTPHIHIAIPPDITRDEIMDAIAKLMAVMQSVPFEKPTVARPAVEQV